MRLDHNLSNTHTHTHINLFLNLVATFSWRGAVIDNDRATEVSKDEEKNEDSTANQKAISSKDPGICCFIFCLYVFIMNK